MAGFTIPNTPNAYNQNQAEPDSLDFQILGNQKNAVISGMIVSPGSGATVAVASGEVIINGTYYSYAGGTVNLTAYSTLPFFDIIVARVASGTITCYSIPGNADTNPRYPAVGTGINDVNFDTDVVLAAVWRPSNSAPTTDMIVDKRVITRPSGGRVASGAVSNSVGSSGDLYVNSTWSADTSLDSALSVKVGATWYKVARSTLITNAMIDYTSVPQQFVTSGSTIPTGKLGDIWVKV